jgi:hypothetical protein
MKIITLIEIYAKGMWSNVSKDNDEIFGLREIDINSDYIIKIEGDKDMENLAKANRLPKGIDKNQAFSRIYLSGNSAITVVDPPWAIKEKINGKKPLLG